MAFCPQCNAPMEPMAAVCPKCGYDFPDPNAGQSPRTGLAYSNLAEFALLVGVVAAVVGCLGSAIAAIVDTIQGNYLIGDPISFFLCLAMMVVFVRVQKA